VRLECSPRGCREANAVLEVRQEEVHFESSAVAEAPRVQCIAKIELSEKQRGSQEPLFAK
jgi:hypothetical protein